jgi:iron-sulfur cluster repair protein YtfE (RIC family)
MGTDASDFLRADHRQVEDHLDRLHDALKHLAPQRVGDVRSNVQEIDRLVGAHMKEEEEIFYPAIRSVAEDLLAQMLKQHEDIREASQVLGQFLANFPAAPKARDLEELYRLGVELHDAVQTHIVDEEDHLLKLADQHLSGQDQQRLLAAMRAIT